MVRPSTSVSRQTTSSGTRSHTVQTSYDTAYGMPLQVTDYRDDAVSTDTVCTETAYNRDDTTWIVDRVRSVLVYDGACGGTLIGRTALYYDNNTTTTAALGAAGNLTATDTWVNGSDFGRAVTAYDGWGRPTRTNTWLGTGDPTVFGTSDRTVANWRTTSIAYTQTGSDYPSVVTTTNDANHASSVTTDGTRGQASVERKATALGGAAPDDTYRTLYGHDALGRLTSVYLPGSGTPNVKYTYDDYSIGTTVVPNRVRTETLTNYGGTSTYLASYAYYDGLGRVRETQVLPPAEFTITKRIITATRYDDAGAVAATTAALNDSTDTPGAGFLNPAASSVPSETRYSYDELGRTTAVDTFGLGVKKFGTATTYYGDRSTTALPRTDTSSYGNVTSYIDVLGRTTKISESLPSGVHSVDYTYDDGGRLTSLTTKAAAAATATTATTEYDWLGRTTKTIDPDAGTTTTVYDRGGRARSTTTKQTASPQATVRTSSTVYDDLDRPTSATATATAATGSPVTTSAWVYDQQPGGTAVVPGALFRESSTAAYAPGADNYAVAATKTADADRTYITDYSSFDSLQRPRTTTYTLPGNEGVLAGSYVFANTWYVDGTPKSVESPAVGPLPAETITYGYDANGYLETATGVYTAGSAYTTPYLKSVANEAYGPAKTLTLGDNAAPATSNISNPAVVNYERSDTATRRLSRYYVTLYPGASTVLDQAIAYDHSGLPTSIADSASRSTGTTTTVAQRECFRYDSQQRLTAYFTQPAATACPATTTSDAAAVDAATVTAASGGPDGYAAYYQLDDLGQLTSVKERRINAGAVVTTTTTLNRGWASYPHAVSSAARAVAGGATGTQTFAYDTSGRMTARTVPAGSHTTGDTANGSKSALTWDGNGRLLSSRETLADGTSKPRAIGYIYDASGQLVARHDDDAADTAATPTGQRTVWLGTGGSQGTAAVGMAGTGGLQIQIHRAKGAPAVDAGTTGAADTTAQQVTVTRAIMAPTGPDGQVQQIAVHTATGSLTSTALAATRYPGRVSWTLGDARGQLAGTGTTTITVPANAASQAGDPAKIDTSWTAGVAGFRRTSPYGIDRTTPASAGPASGNPAATATARSLSGVTGPGGLAGSGFLGATEDTLGAEDGITLPGQAPTTGSGYASTGLVLLGARPYDAVTGSFTAPDPVSAPYDPSDAGSYAYVHGKPMAASDPTGTRVENLAKEVKDKGGTTDCEGRCQRDPVVVEDQGGGILGFVRDIGAGLGNGLWYTGPGLIGDLAGIIPGGQGISDAIHQAHDDLEAWGGANEDSWAYRGATAVGFVAGTVASGGVGTTAKLGSRAAEEGLVLLDTSAVKAGSKARSLLKPGECPVICETVARESAEKGFATGDLAVIPDGMEASIRAQVAEQLRGFGAKAQGFDNDVTIGATAIEKGIPLVTGDRALANAVTKLGGEARFFRPGA